MSFKALAQVTVHPDGTITGRVINHEIPGVGLVENGVYELGLETFSSKLDMTYVGKAEGKADES
ncbi:hypothetical protein CR3_gp057 [Cronobacter phage CR3]|uniref:Uncharacterized protein n=3 Tax=Certrevirus TaxID=1914850 RepID=I1TR99_9CAUD|nr:hypothetical protein CR3_gp057 [Cronobacter phage CR3]YP_009042295.1 hypothetical protein HL10_gp058 [Cronobacter phage CR8]YP_009189028.1 hypothetical protein ADU18_0167 [Cronobacter phage PBES 02]UTC25247.1 hypothetical protein P7_057 [Pectobacterium phage vB_PcaM_P7_Pc]AFH21222.1 hypothetical protein CR3_057 [Cronobacter phage CR3]AIA64588.1 hypothetical protein CR8_058 [Cronobacter phage CR8]AKY04067.1 hypothetical protein ADU18_0167 [Cronobacter phage PBES 02]